MNTEVLAAALPASGPELRAQMIEHFKALAAKHEAERAALDHDDLSLYVVLVADLPVNTDTAQVTSLAQATRYALRDNAKRVAMNTRNGLGEIGTVETLGRAYAKAIKNFGDIAAQIEAIESDLTIA